MIIGSHCSMNGSEMFLGSVKEALSYNANALMVYTGAPQNTIRRPISELRVKEGLELMIENNISRDNLIIHAPYIMNPGSSDPSKRDFAIDFLTQEIKRTYQMGSRIIVLHPGNSLDLPVEGAIDNIAFVVNKALNNTSNLDVVVALETMAGKGSEVGRTFEEVRSLLDKIIYKDRIGVCLDTCHINDGGYDIVNDYENVLNHFDEVIGFDKIKVIHLNDSKNPLGSHKDRHANIGEGFIGFKTLKRLAEDERFKDIPKILETPYKDGVPPYKEEIMMLRK